MSMIDSELTLKDFHAFLPSQGLNGGIDVSKLLIEIQQFAIRTFDRIDSDGNGYISLAELETTLNEPSLLVREISYINFLICNVENITSAFPDSDGASACGISRSDLVSFFAKILSQSDD